MPLHTDNNGHDGSCLRHETIVRFFIQGDLHQTRNKVKCAAKMHTIGLSTVKKTTFQAVCVTKPVRVILNRALCELHNYRIAFKNPFKALISVLIMILGIRLYSINWRSILLTRSKMLYRAVSPPLLLPELAQSMIREPVNKTTLIWNSKVN